MTSMWQTIATVAVVVAAILFIGFVARVIWKVTSGEADRLEAERQARESAESEG